MSHLSIPSSPQQEEEKTMKIPFSQRRSTSRSLRRNNRISRRRKINGKLKQGIERVRAEMAEISEEQKCIREGQRQVREKYEEIEAEREILWKETEQIAKQSASIQMRLNLMFQLVKARAQNDCALVAQLTQSLREKMKF